MKRLLLLFIIMILIPFLVVMFFVNEDKIIEKKYEFITNEDNIVRVFRDSGKNIENVPLEEYVVGVVASEMPVSFELEALKAQAVAARNYVYIKMKENKDKEYDVVDTTQNQVYKNIDELKELWNLSYVSNINKVRQAVNDTIGEVLTYNNEIISLFYFSTSNGFTEDAINVFSSDLPYLKSVSSPWDKEENPNYEKTIQIDRNEFCNKLEINCDNIIISDIKRSNSNRILSIKINNKEFNGRWLYNTLKLRSTDFEISIDDNYITFKTYGFGHGVGMSQYGANGMAKEGKNYKDILYHYYQNTTIKKI